MISGNLVGAGTYIWSLIKLLSMESYKESRIIRFFETGDWVAVLNHQLNPPKDQ